MGSGSQMSSGIFSVGNVSLKYPSSYFLSLLPVSWSCKMNTCLLPNQFDVLFAYTLAVLVALRTFLWSSHAFGFRIAAKRQQAGPGKWVVQALDSPIMELSLDRWNNWPRGGVVCLSTNKPNHQMNDP